MSARLDRRIIFTGLVLSAQQFNRSNVSRILVTGGGGFLGRAIVEQLLSRGDGVRIFARGAYPELAARGVETVRGDLRDANQVEAAVTGCTDVIHTAAFAGIWGKRSDYEAINVKGTRHILTACARHGINRLVFTSSPSVTFAGQDQCGCDETIAYPAHWLCDYPRTKALAEQLVLAANGAAGLSTCALRPHLIWGPNDPHLIPRLIARARAGQLRRIGPGTNLIDTIYVENAAQAHLQALDALAPKSTVCGRAYFLSQGEPVNCWDWIDQVLALVDLPPTGRAIGLRTGRLIGACCEAVHTLLRLPGEPRMTRFLAAQLGTSHYYDIGRARRDFGYKPAVSTSEGMQKLGEWLRSREASRN